MYEFMHAVMKARDSSGIKIPGDVNKYFAKHRKLFDAGTRRIRGRESHYKDFDDKRVWVFIFRDDIWGMLYRVDARAVSSLFFETASVAERRQADLFLADLTGRSLPRPERAFPAASEAEDELWDEAIAALPARYQRAYRDAQTAEEEAGRRVDRRPDLRSVVGR